MEANLDVLKDVQSIATWVAQNAGPLLVALTILALLLVYIRRRGDRADRIFRRAGLRVPAMKIQQLREEFARAAIDVERQRVAAENRQQLETSAIEAEKARILSLVRSTPHVVKEVGEALRAIEQEYEQGMRTVKSDQAREGMRRTAEKQIQDVLRSVSNDPGHLPQFHIADNRDRERDTSPKRPRREEERSSA
jgi:NTP pyrophosphatase (non-canonical NTP hydrolase)